MEIFLWLIVYLAFVLPIIKCIYMSTGWCFLDCIMVGIYWPAALPAICIVYLLDMFVELVAKLSYLIED